MVRASRAAAPLARPEAAARAAAEVGVLERLRALAAGLPPKAAGIAAVILERPDEVVDMSVTELAAQAGASEGSVVALCQQLGLRGFQQLKLAIARDRVQPVQVIHEDLARSDDPRAVIDKVFASGLQALQDTRRVLDADALGRAAASILAAERVEVYGIGSAAPIAEDAHYRLLRIGIRASVAVDSHVQAISAALTNPRVATLTISHSGATHETLAATRLAKEAGATTICITNYGRSPILAHADIVLHTAARETRFRTEAMTSRVAQLAIVDTLIACLGLATYDRAVETIRRTSDVLAIKRI